MIHAPSCVAGVVTPPAAIASIIAPVSDCSLTPGANSARAASSACSATPSAPRSTAISSAVLIRRAARSAGSASTSSALGNAIGSSCANVGVSESVPTLRTVVRTGQLLEDVDQRHRIPRQPVEVVVADLVGDALIPCAVQVNLAGRADHLADRAERPGARDPQLRRPGDVPDVGLAPEDEDVDVVVGHLGKHPLATAAAQSFRVGQDFERHQARPYGA